MTGKTREEVQAEVDAINQMKRDTQAQVLPCGDCYGRGWVEYPVYGDPRLGYDRQKCFACGGTGNRLRFRR